MSTDKAPSQEPNFIPVDGLSYVMPMPSPDAAAAEKDAARYRWLHANLNQLNPKPSLLAETLSDPFAGAYGDSSEWVKELKELDDL